jgi:3-phosphoshikimate 1-carboxyvinyltransferase
MCPGDISSAAFFIVAALLVPGSEILLRNVNINPTRAGILQVLKDMGADITLQNSRGGRVNGLEQQGMMPSSQYAGGSTDSNGPEPVADLLVKYSQLHGTTVSGEIIPTLIDELPVIAIAASLASGVTFIKDAAELKVKESDRIAVMTEGLKAMGADIAATPDGWVINGVEKLHGAEIACHADHRIAMSFAVASLAADGETVLDDEKCVRISYPEFFEDLKTLC